MTVARLNIKDKTKKRSTPKAGGIRDLKGRKERHEGKCQSKKAEKEIGQYLSDVTTKRCVTTKRYVKARI